jgi:hypothetical protein
VERQCSFTTKETRKLFEPIHEKPITLADRVLLANSVGLQAVTPVRDSMGVTHPRTLSARHLAG